MTRISDLLLISDVDSTALKARQDIPPQNIEAVQRFVQKGGRFTFATGRSMKMLRVASDHFTVNAPLIAHNGAFIWDPYTGRALMRQPLPAVAATMAATVVERYNGHAAVMAVGEEQYYSIAPSTESWAIAQKNALAGATERNLSDIEEELFKVLVMTQTVEDAADARTWIGQTFGDAYNVVRSGAHIVEVVGKDVHKGHALRTVGRLLGVRAENIIAIGDSENDIEMLEAAGYSAAPSNACAKVLDIADKVLCSCMDGALAALIESLEHTYTN